MFILMPEDRDMKGILKEALVILSNMREKSKPLEDQADNFLKRLEYDSTRPQIEQPIPPSPISPSVNDSTPTIMDVLSDIKDSCENWQKNKHIDEEIASCLLNCSEQYDECCKKWKEHWAKWDAALNIAIGEIDAWIEKIKPPG
jgi:hypothetical protein